MVNKFMVLLMAEYYSGGDIEKWPGMWHAWDRREMRERTLLW